MTPPPPPEEELGTGLLVRGERGGEDGARLVTSESVLACILLGRPGRSALLRLDLLERRRSRVGAAASKAREGRKKIGGGGVIDVARGRAKYW